MSVRFRWGVKVPLRDGIHLNASLYLPGERPGPAPCVCAMTPYMTDLAHDRGIYFASRGLPFAIVDVRGRGNSEGHFRPNIQEAKDGHDVVEWLARQPFCNGRIGMWGGSYLGYSQWATAKELPSHLATIVPTAAPCKGVDSPMRNNIFSPYVLQWLLLTQGRTAQFKMFADMPFWSKLYREWHESGRAFRDLDTMYGNPSQVFQEWLSHPERDEYWDSFNPTAEQYARINLPILTITGSYDDDQPGALEHYSRHLLHAGKEASARHFLLIGPWDHAGSARPSTRFGGLTLDSASELDLPQLHRDWYAWTMEGGPRPAFLKDRVTYYVMGAEHWRHAPTLEAVTSGHRTYFLDSTGYANGVFCAGKLGGLPGRGQPDAYRYDPRDTRGPEVEAEASSSVASLTDQSLALALHGRQFVYHSEPFDQDMEVSGFFRLRAWIAIDCPDTDIYVSVHEIARDGSSIRLSTDAIRARYREGLSSPRLIATSAPLQYDFDRFTFVSRQIKRGHFLRLIIAPVGHVVDTAFFQKNYNGGGVVAEETVKDARPVTVTLLHDAEHPSALYVPIGQGNSPRVR